MAKPIRQRDKWRVRWIDEHGRRQSAVYDDYKQAQHELKQRQVEVEQVRRGLRAPSPPTKTFDDLCDYWLEHRASRKRSRKDNESMIRRHLRPSFGLLNLLELGVEHVDRFVATCTSISPKTLANILTALIAMLNLAKDLGWIQVAPRIRKPRVRILDQDFHYLRSNEEIDRFLGAAAEEGTLVRTLYACALYTGMRQGELAALRWSDVDFERRLITVQRSFDGPTKGGEVRYVPILDPLLPLLRSWRLQSPLPIVFPNQRGGMQGKSGRVFQEVLHRVLDRAGFEELTIGNRKRRYIVFHDLRHSFASHRASQPAWPASCANVDPSNGLRVASARCPATPARTGPRRATSCLTRRTFGRPPPGLRRGPPRIYALGAEPAGPDTPISGRKGFNDDDLERPSAGDTAAEAEDNASRRHREGARSRRRRSR